MIFCSECGKRIQYSYFAVAEEGEIRIGVECVKRLRATGAIDGKLPLHGRYDWTLSQIRYTARNNWLAARPLPF